MDKKATCRDLLLSLIAFRSKLKVRVVGERWEDCRDAALRHSKCQCKAEASVTQKNVVATYFRPVAPAAKIVSFRPLAHLGQKATRLNFTEFEVFAEAVQEVSLTMRIRSLPIV